PADRRRGRAGGEDVPAQQRIRSRSGRAGRAARHFAGRRHLERRGQCDRRPRQRPPPDSQTRSRCSERRSRMNSFEYASPRTEEEAVELLSAHGGNTAVLAGGTDLFNLLRAGCIGPERVVDIKNIESMQGVTSVSDGLMIGALTTLDEILAHPLV